ncbi:hypothetical protein PVK06_020928 [Gossypium arboreum]|uniref:Uncharacterized protein n=1 Tax=Gossypium arboreum TaxID=29729 RepID=A0ABR0PNN3_GOSAR|nr:hypothetical protein PVK06_020928 [Gossypium arboreum]
MWLCPKCCNIQLAYQAPRKDWEDEKVYEILDEMEEKEGCSLNNATFNYLLKFSEKPEEVPGVLERVEKNCCNMSCDTYNLILRLYMKWDHEERVRHMWDEIEKSGLGPDQ